MHYSVRLHAACVFANVILGYRSRARGTKSPAFLTRLQCTGVETKLTNCQRGSQLTKDSCGSIIQVYTNNGKFTINLHVHVQLSISIIHPCIVPRSCENGELKKDSNNVLRICVNAVWKTLCPMLWGPPQAIVACRQLNPGKLIIGKQQQFVWLVIVTSLCPHTGSVTKAVQGTPSFKYHFFCNGNEKQITDCVVGDYAVNANICGNSKVTALMCISESYCSLFNVLYLCHNCVMSCRL